MNNKNRFANCHRTNAKRFFSAMLYAPLGAVEYSFGYREVTLP
ncbi:MAG: hypothetical protein R3Y61_01585 [Rikenellaceae bacterium]